MDPTQALSILAEYRTDQLVIPTMTSSHIWDRLSDHRLDLPLKGCMGKASSLGLGAALARPDIPVWVIDGDGSLLSNLGSLVTVGNMAPPNLIHFVLNDGGYRASGGQPIPGAGKVDFCALADAAGYVASFSFDVLEDLRLRLPGVLETPGPVFVCLQTEPSQERIGHIRKGSTAEALSRVKANLEHSAAATV